MYKPVRYIGPNDALKVAQWAEREHAGIEQGFTDLDLIRLVEQHRAPEKPREGDIRFADGTDWNPGAGKGIYAFYSAAWNKLG